MSKPLISHIGIAVADLTKAIEKYSMLTGGHPEVCEVPDQKVKVAIFSGGDESNGGRIELVAPTADDSPVAKYLEKKGEGLHHIAYKTDNIDAQLASASASGARLIHEQPIIGAGGKLVAFIHPKSSHGVLTEFCASPENG